MSDAVVGPVDSVLEEVAVSSGHASAARDDSFVDTWPNSIAVMRATAARADLYDISVDSPGLFRAGSVGDPVELSALSRTAGKGNEVGTRMKTFLRRHAADADHGHQDGLEGCTGPRGLAAARAHTPRTWSGDHVSGPPEGSLPSSLSGTAERVHVARGRRRDRTCPCAK